jgi:leucyl-tRNA synthetase
MKFNTAVSSLMTYVNYLSGRDKVAPELFYTLVKLMCPFTPHLAEEMWARLGYSSLVVAESWPVGDAKLAEDTKVTYAVQICGKVRGTIEMPKDAPREDVEKAALEVENVKKQIEGKEIRKMIVVPNKIVNLVV